MQVLITAGATRNPVDTMRYLSARSTGSTGVTIARALIAKGHSIWLLGSAETRLRGTEVPGEEYGSTHDLMSKMKTWVLANPDGVVIHSAAVGDYECSLPNQSKIPSGMKELHLTLTPTPKIADHIREWGLIGKYITFKAAAPETSAAELGHIAQRQRQRTGSDRVFANILGKLATGVLWVGEEVESFEKREDALQRLIDWVDQSRF